MRFTNGWVRILQNFYWLSNLYYDIGKTLQWNQKLVLGKLDTLCLYPANEKHMRLNFGGINTPGFMNKIISQIENMYKYTFGVWYAVI